MLEGLCSLALQNRFSIQLKRFYLPYLLFFVGLTQVMAQHSVLTNGTWLKIGVTQAGIYQLDADFLRKAGIEPSTLNPKNLKLYGNGGGMLPQANATPRPNDLTENAIFVEGEADGKFDNQDFILFYGQSPHAILYDSTTQRFRHEYNLYSDTTFYFLTISATPSLRIVDRNAITATKTVTTFDDYVFQEQDLKNMVQSGREWYGEDFGLLISERNTVFDLPNIVPNSTVLVTSAVMAAAQGATEFQVKLNGQIIGKQVISGVTSDRYDYKGSENTTTFSMLATNSSGNQLSVTHAYNRNNIASALGYLNYVGVQAKRALTWTGKAFSFRTIESVGSPAVIYQLSQVSDLLTVWDITDPLRPVRQQTQKNNTQLSFGAPAERLREFVAFTDKDFLKPAVVRAISNQDLHGTTTPNLLIITAPKFRQEVERLADFRRTNDKLSVLVATTEQVFNEFSSGQPDPTALRDAVRYFYHQQPTTLRYLLLFGDAKFDPKNRTNSVEAKYLNDYVPVYESRESLSPLYSFSSDDYFGFLETKEGDWAETYAGDHTLEIGIGRLPVKTEQEAKNAVDKLVRYQNPKSIGKWRNHVTLVADDGDGNLHQLDADALAQLTTNKYPNYLTDKVFLDAYPQNAGSTGSLAPQVNGVINQAVGNSLIVNYTGHGGEAVWAQEQILTRADVLGWNNYDKLPFFVTATCEFGRYDDPNVVSGAELSLLSPKGGAIGLITTTRPVFANTNFLVNDAFYRAVFEPINGQMPRIGDVMKQTKNNSLSGRINRNFALLGDPSMRLAYPQQQVILTKLNGKSVTEKLDTLKALSKITLEGEIRLPNSNVPNTAFTGTLSVVVFDKETTTTTQGTESVKMSFQERKSVLFEGRASVKNGVFACTFIVPKDINPQIGKGKISFYAQNAEGIDGAGSFINALVGGEIVLPTADKQGPAIQLFMNNEQFQNGGITDEKPLLIAKLSDDSGINLSSNSIVVTLDDTLNLTLNAYFEPTLDDNRAGTIQYPFRNLKPGNHTVKLKGRDTYNNQAEASLNFVVAPESKIHLRNILCYPNPFSERTNFEFEHDFDGEDLGITLDIYNTAGQRLRQLQVTDYRSVSPFTQLSWDGSSDSAQKIAKGLYFYRIFARSLQTNVVATGAGKVFYSR